MAENKNAVRLTAQILQQLKDNGFKYVLIKGYSLNKKFDWIELNTFRLTPVKELPIDPAQKEIFEEVNSEILTQWASSKDDIKAYVEMPR